METPTFDFVIVGAGAAGCVLASRLTEDARTRVALLEAGGPDEEQKIRIPAAFSKLFQTPIDWNYFTEEEPRLKNRRLYWPRGKVLGGSSSINAMIYIRGNRWDFDNWERLTNRGWSFADVLPYFKKSENQERGASEYHGAGGPMNVADLRHANPLTRAFLAACNKIGIPQNPDFNGGTQEGVGLYQVTQRGGRRWSAADAYLKPALKRPNLRVETRAHVERILFDGRRAIGVRYRRDGSVLEVRVRREVIVSGGTVNSPQLLLLSGIGPAAHLREMEIPAVCDLPGVGKNLQDHLMVAIGYECKQPVSLQGAETRANFLRWLILRGGPLTSNVAEAGAFLRTQPDSPVPDLQLLFGPAYYLNHGFNPPKHHCFGFGPTLIAPRSRGEIMLWSRDACAPPAIRPNYLSEKADLRVLIEGLKLSRQIAHSESFEPYCGREMYPGAELQTDEQITDAVRAGAETLYHPVGTCKMGTDEMAVVDPQLRVRGVEGLRVVDASIMPVVTAGNTNAPTIMIAEKAADMIRK